MRETNAAGRRGKGGNFSLEVPGKNSKGLMEEVRRPQCEGPAWKEALDGQRPRVSPASSIDEPENRPGKGSTDGSL